MAGTEPQTSAKFDSKNLKRVREVDLSLFNPEYTVRSQMVRFLMAQPWRKSRMVLDFGAGNSPYRPFFDCEKYLRADVGYNVEIPSDFVINPDAPKLPVEDGALDLVICLDVLEHVKEFPATLREIHRMLKPGGRFVAKIPFVYREHEVPFDFRRFTTYGISLELKQAGFDVENVETFGNAWSAAYTIINERWVLNYDEMPIHAKIASRLFNKTLLPVLNGSLFKAKHQGIYQALIAVGRKAEA